jgi:peptidoglycan hydrolase CwlO-like protein
MRKPVVVFSLVAAVVLLLGAAFVLYQKLQARTAEYTTLQANEQETRRRYSQAIDEIAAIQDSLNAIALGEEGARQLATQLQAERNLSQNTGERALARINEIKEGISRARGRIQDLEKQLHTSNVQIAGLQKLVRNLRTQISDREATIVQLQQRVQSLETEVTGLNTQVAEGQQKIQEQQTTIEDQATRIEDARREISTIYYVIGSKDDLKNAGLIEGKGGFLGIGKTWKPSGQVDETKFTSLDTDQETVIPIPADKARVVSAQPVSSYELKASGEQMELQITDTKAFRTVKHVIIMTG